jgi:hypothetical protein
VIKSDILIDEQDRHLIDGKKVWLSAGYPTIWVGKPKKFERLHRLIANPPRGYGVDHINRNKLDARRANLRVCKQRDNVLNVPARKDSASGIRGVWFDKARGLWATQISHRGKRLNLGRFRSMEQAVAARREKEIEIWGQFAPT